MKRFIHNFGTRYVRILAILFLWAGFMHHGHVWAYESSGLNLSLHPDTTHAYLKFTLGEPIKLIMVINNNTGGTITTDRGFSQVELHRSLIIVDPGGKRHELGQEDKGHKMPQAFPRNDKLWLLAETLRADWVRSVTIEDLTELIPMMKTTPGWYTIEAQRPFIRFARTGQDAALGFLGLLDSLYIWDGTVNSKKMQIYIFPGLGAQLQVRVLDDTADPTVPLTQVPVRVFRVNDLPPGYGLEDVWDQFEPVLIGTTNFEGWAVWNSGTPCIPEIPEDSYTAIACYSNEYQESLIASGLGVGWATECTGSIERIISFAEAAQEEIITVSGGAYNYPEGGRYRASFSMDVNNEDPGPSGWLKYYYTRTRMYFISSEITEVSVSGSVVIISGTGTVNGIAGYSFEANVTDGNPDNFGIIIKNSSGSIYYTAETKEISGGDLEIIIQ